MFELNIFKEDKKETFEEFIARKKKEFLSQKSVINPPLFKSLKGVPFGPNGLSIIEARIRNEVMNLKSISANRTFESDFTFRENKRFTLPLKENSYFDENAEDEELDDQDKILSESINISDVPNIIKDFSDEYHVAIKIIKPDSQIYEKMKNMNVAFHTIECNNENMYQLHNYDDIFKLNFTGNAESYLILVAPRLIAYTLMDEEPIKRLLLHEYGHTKTMHKLALNDWIEYFLKNGVLNDIEKLRGHIGFQEFHYLELVKSCVYYNLYPEYLANKYVNLDFRVLLRDLNHTDPPMDWRHSELARIINIAIPIHILPILKKGIIDGIQLNPDDSAACRIFMANLYNDCFSERAAFTLINNL